MNTVIAHGALQASLEDFCELIISRRSLRQAQVTSTECYTERNRGILHRFLVLELCREGKKPIFIRVDRRVSASTMGLLFGFGSAPAKDTVSFTPDFVPRAVSDLHFSHLVYRWSFVGRRNPWLAKGNEKIVKNLKRPLLLWNSGTFPV